LKLLRYDMGIRVMEKEDIEFATSLTAEEGWYYTPRELEVMLRLDPEGSFIFEEDERLGISTSVTYGRTGVLGHLVVSKKGRGRKIGSSLLKVALDHMTDRGVDSILLYAAQEAVSLYSRHGFAPRDEIYCVHLDLRDSHKRIPSRTCARMKRQDLSEVAELDERLFGDDRSALMKALYDEGPNHAFKIERDGRIVGYVMARHDHIGYDLGPWACTSDDSADAESLFLTALSTLEEGTIYMGSFFKNKEAVRIADTVPKTRSWRIPLMIRGKERYATDPHHTFGIAAFELG
jgi:ribosomal protein S18 acetylase RimI-like enzyme